MTLTEVRASASGVENLRWLTLGPPQLISSSFMRTACLSQSKDLVQGQAQMVPLRKSLIQSTQSKDGPVSHQVEETQQTETQKLSLATSLAYHSSSKPGTGNDDRSSAFLKTTVPQDGP